MDYRGMGHYDPTVTASSDEMLRTYNIHLILILLDAVLFIQNNALNV